MTLDAALLDLHAAVARILLHRPRRQQDAVRHALRDVAAAARAEAAAPRLDAREQLRAALDRAAEDLGWSDTMVVVNQRARLHAGSIRRAG